MGRKRKKVGPLRKLIRSNENYLRLSLDGFFLRYCKKHRTMVVYPHDVKDREIYRILRISVPGWSIVPCKCDYADFQDLFQLSHRHTAHALRFLQFDGEKLEAMPLTLKPLR